MKRPHESGGRWEDEAESFLTDRGLKTLKRNYYCRLGEIDLVMQHEDCIVFLEVRYRNNQHFGSGADSVTRSKQLRIIRTARSYLQKYGGRQLPPCRFDVISMRHHHGKLNVEWIQDAFMVE